MSTNIESDIMGSEIVNINVRLPKLPDGWEYTGEYGFPRYKEFYVRYNILQMYNDFTFRTYIEQSQGNYYVHQCYPIVRKTKAKEIEKIKSQIDILSKQIQALEK